MTTLITKNSSTALSVPTAGDLSQGELAVNVTDKKLYTKDSLNNIVELVSTNDFTDADHSKLNGIETGATADQTAAEIRTLVELATDSNVFTDADHSKLNGIESNATADQSASEIKTAYESNADTNAYTDAEQTKLGNIETNADVTDATNVAAAGALMDSEVTNLAQVKSFNSADYATAAQGTLATNALPKSGGAMTGAITTTSTFDGRDVAVDGAKLDGIEASATADQTAAEILTALLTVDGSGSNLDADKVDGFNISTAASGTDANTIYFRTV